MTKIKKDPSKQDLVDKLNNTLRYLDGFQLKIIQFQKLAKEIYPKESNIHNDRTPFSDFDLKLSRDVYALKFMKKGRFFVSYS